MTTSSEWSQGFLDLVFGDKFDWTDEHYADTPIRFVKMLRELTTPEEVNFTTFRSSTNEMVIVKNIPFTALCAHHIVPFSGYCHVGYIPGERIAGLSKFARVVRNMAKTLTVQEELTRDIANFLEDKLLPEGLAVLMEAEHLCMTIRGVQTPGTVTSTSVMRGAFADHNRLARQEFLELVRDRK